MKLKLSPGLQGLITGLLMIVVAMWIDSKKETISAYYQYLIYIVYAAGIFWTLFSYMRNDESTVKFSSLFNRGFRCFVVVSLIMVVFTIIFIKTHPEFAAQEAAATKEYYMQKGDKTPAEIEELAVAAKKRYPVIVISLSIFRYLLIGAGFTALFSAVLNRRK